MSNFTDRPLYGIGDTSYREAGGSVGIRILCTDFYEIMSTLSEAKKIREMHQDDLSVMIDKLTLFLSMWLGGPKDYRSVYGMRGMPEAHRHLVINQEEKKAWLLCMKLAIERQEYSESFKRYLYNQLCKPAEFIYQTSLKE